MTDRSHRPSHARSEAANGDERRARTRAEERIAELDTSPAALMAQLDEVREQLVRAEREAEENRAGWQRTAADFQNFRRRTEQDRQQTLGLANEALLVKVLNVADDFDRAIANIPPELQGNGWVEGVVAIDRKLRSLLDSEGLTPIEAQGAQFDPHQHEAVVQQETTAVPEGTVTAELQRGYRLRDRVLRPALVAVAKHPDGNKHDTNEHHTNEHNEKQDSTAQGADRMEE